MPVLPIIDLFILLGWTTLAAGAVLKAIHITTSYRPTLASLTPLDLLWIAIAFLAMALTLAARTWVRLNEPALLARDRRSPAPLDDFRGGVANGAADVQANGNHGAAGDGADSRGATYGR